MDHEGTCLSDPHPTDASPPRHPELAPAVAFTVAIVAGLGLGVVYWVGGQTQLEGILLALACGGIGVGIVLWAKRFLPPVRRWRNGAPLPRAKR